MTSRRTTEIVLLVVLTCAAVDAVGQNKSNASKRVDKNVEVQTHLGMVAAEANDLKAAEKHFAVAASLAPSDPSARNNYGAILMRLGRTAEARTQFEASLKINPNQASALTNLAQIYFDLGQLDDLRMACSLLERAGKSTPDPQISRALVTTYVRLGQVLIEKGSLDEAIAELSTALAIEPMDPDVLVTLSRAQLLKKDIRAAGRTLETAVASGLDVAKVYAALADVYEADGRFENAIPAMRLAIQRDPKNELYHFHYGLLLTDSHAPAAAMVRLQEALKQFPNSARLWLAMGIAQFAYRQNVEAEKSFKRALEIDPKVVPALAYLGVTYTERGQYKEAIEFYKQAIALNTQLAPLYYLLADTMLKMSDADTVEAEQYLKRATELDPNLASAYLTWARLYVRSNRYSEAAPLLERAVSLQPELLEAHYQLGRVLVKLKRTDEANRELQIFKDLSEKQNQRDEPREIVRRLANVRF